MCIVNAPTSFQKINVLILSQELRENTMRDHYNDLLSVAERLNKSKN
jgi:hypothetical protein